MLPKAYNCQHKHAIILFSFEIAICKITIFFWRRHAILPKSYYTNGFMLPKAQKCQHKHALILFSFKIDILLVVFVKKLLFFRAGILLSLGVSTVETNQDRD